MPTIQGVVSAKAPKIPIVTALTARRQETFLPFSALFIFPRRKFSLRKEKGDNGTKPMQSLRPGSKKGGKGREKREKNLTRLSEPLPPPTTDPPSSDLMLKNLSVHMRNEYTVLMGHTHGAERGNGKVGRCGVGGGWMEERAWPRGVVKSCKP